MITTQLHVEKYSAGRQSGEVPHLVISGEVRKCCAKCGRLRPLEAYSRHPTTWDGLGSTCRSCLGQQESLGERVYVPPAPQRPAPVALKKPAPLRNLRTPEQLRESHRRGAAAGAVSKAKKQGAPPASASAGPPPGVLTDPWKKAPAEKRWAYFGKEGKP